MSLQNHKATPYIGGILLMSLVCYLELHTSLYFGTVSYFLIVLAVLWKSVQYRFYPLIAIAATVCIFVSYHDGHIVSDPLGPVFNQSLSIIAIWLTVYLATRYRRLESAKKKYKQQLNAVFRNATEGILLINKEGKIVLGNPCASRMFGYTDTSMLGIDVELLIPERIREKHVNFRRLFTSAPRTRSLRTGKDLFAVTRSGKEFPVEISLSYFYDHDELFVMVFVVDITRRKEQEKKIASHYMTIQQLNEQLEGEVKHRTGELENALTDVQKINTSLKLEIEERKQVEEKLKKSQFLYTAIARNFPDGIIIVLDQDLRCVFMEGKDLRHGLVARDGDYSAEEISSILTTNAQDQLKPAFRGMDTCFEVPIHGKTFEGISTAIANGAGVINEILVVLRDVSKHKKLEKDLLNALEKERQLNLLKSRFVSSVSHEFRTPLSTILSSVFLLENYLGPDKQAQDNVHFNRIKRSVTGLTELLEDFLSLEKLEEGKVRVVYSEFYVSDFLRDLVDEMSAITKEDQKITYSFKGDEDLVMLDKNLLTNIISNLVSNAIKYSPPDGLIEIEAAVEENTFRFSILDHGMGIPESEQKHVFKRFYRAHNAVNIQGTGLGLNLVQKYVRLMKGTIRFTSNLKEGSVFYVSLPVATTSSNLPQTYNPVIYG